MRSKSEIISLLTDPGIIAVVRLQNAGQVLPLSEALIAGGIIAIEITMTTPNAIEAIRNASRNLGPRAVMGVGTVLDSQTCREAIEAGAEFVVSPILRPEIVRTSGRTVTLTWSGNVLTDVTDPIGNVYSYAYAVNKFGAGQHLLTQTTQPGAANPSASGGTIPITRNRSRTR